MTSAAGVLTGLPKVLHVTEPRAAMIGWAVIGHQVGQGHGVLASRPGCPVATHDSRAGSDPRGEVKELERRVNRTGHLVHFERTPGP